MKFYSNNHSFSACQLRFCAGPYERAKPGRVYTRVVAHFKEGAGLSARSPARSLARDMDTILLLRCSDSTKLAYTCGLRADIPPAAMRAEPFARAHLTMGHTNKVEQTRAHAHYSPGGIFSRTSVKLTLREYTLGSPRPWTMTFSSRL